VIEKETPRADKMEFVDTGSMCPVIWSVEENGVEVARVVSRAISQPEFAVHVGIAHPVLLETKQQVMEFLETI
jgi:hypothetical protein